MNLQFKKMKEFKGDKYSIHFQKIIKFMKNVHIQEKMYINTYNK